MPRKRAVFAGFAVFLVLLLCAILTLWVLNNKQRTERSASEGNPKPSELEGARNEPKKPDPRQEAEKSNIQPTARPVEEDELFPLIKWDSVPDFLAMAVMPMTVSGASPEGSLVEGWLPGGTRPAYPIEVLLEMWTWKAFLSPDEFDSLNRSWALVSSLDFLLGQAVGLKLAEKASIETEFYFPMVVANGFLAPKDSAGLTTRLSTLINEGFGELLGRMPEQYAGPGLASAFRARAVMALASLGRSFDTTTALTPFVADQDPRVRAAAAFGLAVQGRAEAAIQILANADDSSDVRALLGALGSYDHRRDPPELTIGYDRTLDPHILESVRRIGSSAPDSGAFHTGLWALSFRVDRPEIADYVVSLARKEPTQEVALAIANAGRKFSDYPPYRDALLGWLESPSDQIKIVALKGLTSQRGEQLPRRALPFVESANPLLARGAVLSLHGSLEANPSASLELLRRAAAKWQDEDVLLATADMLHAMARNHKIEDSWRVMAKQMLQDVRAKQRSLGKRR